MLFFICFAHWCTHKIKKLSQIFFTANLFRISLRLSLPSIDFSLSHVFNCIYLRALLLLLLRFLCRLASFFYSALCGVATKCNFNANDNILFLRNRLWMFLNALSIGLRAKDWIETKAMKLEFRRWTLATTMSCSILQFALIAKALRDTKKKSIQTRWIGNDNDLWDSHSRFKQIFEGSFFFCNLQRFQLFSVARMLI